MRFIANLTYFSFPGTSRMGKLGTWLAGFSGFVLLILLGMACTLKGGKWEGFVRFVSGDLSKLKEAKTWYEAFNQNLFSMGLLNGNLFKVGSDNKFRRKIYLAVVWIALADLVVSLVAGEIL